MLLGRSEIFDVFFCLFAVGQLCPCAMRCNTSAISLCCALLWTICIAWDVGVYAIPQCVAGGDFHNQKKTASIRNCKKKFKRCSGHMHE